MAPCTSSRRLDIPVTVQTHLCGELHVVLLCVHILVLLTAQILAVLTHSCCYSISKLCYLLYWKYCIQPCPCDSLTFTTECVVLLTLEWWMCHLRAAVLPWEWCCQLCLQQIVLVLCCLCWPGELGCISVHTVSLLCPEQSRSGSANSELKIV